jgi:hypothetical protein
VIKVSTWKSRVPAPIRNALIGIEALGYRVSLAALMPVNDLLARALARRVVHGSVLHISAMVHVPYYTVRILREHGIAADYLAVGDSPWWNTADFHYRPRRLALGAVIQEMWWLWRVVSRYQIVHSHFMVTLTRTGWEWPLLRRMGCHIVVHYRGCEIRNRSVNERLHPAMNICQECDYDPAPCATPLNERRRRLAARWGSAFLVTTPDMKDFVPEAVHVPFFATRPDIPSSPPAARHGRPFKIVHATNHPGIEGTRQIREAIAAAIAKGHAIKYVELTDVTHERVLRELADADLSIGKMKMGHYANLQVESMMAGVPTITYVRPEFMTERLRQSGFIFATLDKLNDVLDYYLSDPTALEAKRALARRSILALHDNAAIAREYRALYERLASS